MPPTKLTQLDQQTDDLRQSIKAERLAIRIAVSHRRAVDAARARVALSRLQRSLEDVTWEIGQRRLGQVGIVTSEREAFVALALDQAARHCRRVSEANGQQCRRCGGVMARGRDGPECLQCGCVNYEKART